jgi:hypothetical protein
VKNLRDDQDELKKICQRFAGTTRPLTFLRECLSVKEFVLILDFIPDLGKQASLEGDGVNDTTFHEANSEREILIFFGDVENVIVPYSSPVLITNQKYSSLESFPSDFTSESESFGRKLKEIYVQNYSVTSTQESFMSSAMISSESYDMESESFADMESESFADMESESFANDSESSNEIIFETSNDKATLINKAFSEESLQVPPQVKQSKAFRKTQKILLVSALIFVVIAGIKFASSK